jgi:S-layer protein
LARKSSFSGAYSDKMLEIGLLKDPSNRPLTTGVDADAAFVGAATNDTFKADAAAKFGAFDVLDGGAGDDKIVFTDTSATAFTLSTLATVKSIEAIEVAHTSDAAGATDAVTLDVSGYSSVKSISIANQAVDTAGTATANVTVTSKSNLTSLTIDGGALAADVGAVTISDAGANGDATAASADTLASVTLIGTSTVTLASEALTSLTLNAAGAVTNTDTFTTDARALTVNFAGGTNGGVSDAGATAVLVKATAAVADLGGLDFANATSVIIDNTGGGKISAGHVHAAKATSVAVIADNAVTVSDLAFGSTTVKTLDISGDSLVTVSDFVPELAATGVLTVSGSAGFKSALGLTGGASVSTAATTGTVTLGATTVTAGIGNAVAYTGGAGKDVLSIGATTKAIALAGGDDTLSMTGAAFGTGGSVDAGEGNDTLAMTAENAATASASAAFEAKISGFEVLSIGATSTAARTIDVANLDDISNVKFAGGSTALTVNSLQATNLFTQTALTSDAVALNLLVAVGTSDVVNVKFEAAAGFVNTGVITVASVETVNITTSDTSVSTDLTPVITAFTAPIAAAAATSVVVTGNAGLNLTGSTLSAVTSFDASAVTGFVADDGTNAAGAVTYTTGALTASVTVKGGAGDDVLNASATATAGKSVTIFGNGGTDTLTGSATLASTIDGGAGDDAITGGSAADTLNGGDGVDRITLGGGLDVVTGGAGKDTFVVTAASTTSSVYGRVTDAATGDKIEFADLGVETFASTKIALAATASFGDYLNAAAAGDGSTNGAISWFQFGGNTYVVEDRSAAATFTGGADIVVQLDGLVNFTAASLAGNVLTIA